MNHLQNHYKAFVKEYRQVDPYFVVVIFVLITLFLLCKKDKDMTKIKISADEYRRLVASEMKNGKVIVPGSKKNSTTAPKNAKSVMHTSNKGWRTVGGKNIFFRSSWEYNYALYLQWQKEQNEILDWEHEPQYFEFPIKHGVTRYLPDFIVTAKDRSQWAVEVKGFMDSKSATKIKRFRTYFPQIDLIIIDKKWFADNKNLRFILKGWE